jgi:hypothetical protein
VSECSGEVETGAGLVSEGGAADGFIIFTSVKGVEFGDGDAGRLCTWFF